MNNISQIILNGLTTDQFKELIVQALSGLVPSHEKAKEETKYLTRAEAAKLLQISLPTLHDYTKRGVIQSFRIGSNVRYKTSDVESALSARNFTSIRKGGRNAA